MGGLVKAIFGGGSAQGEYDKTLAEQEHRKKLAEEEARQKTLAQAKATALSEAERIKKQKAFLASSTTLNEDENALGGSKSLLG